MLLDLGEKGRPQRHPGEGNSRQRGHHAKARRWDQPGSQRGERREQCRGTVGQEDGGGGQDQVTQAVSSQARGQAPKGSAMLS